MWTWMVGERVCDGMVRLLLSAFRGASCLACLSLASVTQGSHMARRLFARLIQTTHAQQRPGQTHVQDLCREDKRQIPECRFQGPCRPAHACPGEGGRAAPAPAEATVADGANQLTGSPPLPVSWRLYAPS